MTGQNNKAAATNGWRERQWRHLDTCQFDTITKARVLQLKYSYGTAGELTVPWAERYSQVTILMAGFVIKMLEACPTTQAVCTLTRLSWGTVNAIMVSAVERGMLRRTEEKDFVPRHRREEFLEGAYVRRHPERH